VRPDGATWRSGYAPVCKTVYTSSILVVASINTISGLRRAFERPIGGVPYQQAAFRVSRPRTSHPGTGPAAKRRHCRCQLWAAR
jgi:hypothetical protein